MFQWIDAARRQAGLLMVASGLGTVETPYRIAAEFEPAHLRAYQAAHVPDGPVLLIIPAPFKRPYIWDLVPQVSVVRRCLSHGIAVYLLEWKQPERTQDQLGLGEYADRLLMSACDAIAAESGLQAITLAGHSLGGTFAAIFATLHPERLRLLLIDTPIDFGGAGDPIASTVPLLPHARLVRMFGSPVSGSLLNLLSICAAPDIFLWQRVMDLVASSSDPRAAAIHLHVLRWTLDEFAMPGQLFEDVVELLYRENRLMRGSLALGGRCARLENLRAPLLAVINPASGIVPVASSKAAIDAVGPSASRVLTYVDGRGPVIQHLGPLVAPTAHEHLWPKIVRWLAAQS